MGGSRPRPQDSCRIARGDDSDSRHARTPDLTKTGRDRTKTPPALTKSPPNITNTGPELTRTPSRREAFEAAFFADLEQQPLGPGVVNSVGLFAARVEGLEASADPDAQSFRALLSARGLTEERVAELKAMVAQAQAVAKPRRAPDAEALANMQASRAERLEALQQLRDWYAEWSVGLRPLFTGREQVKLGLSTRKKKTKAKAKAPVKAPAGDGDDAVG